MPHLPTISDVMPSAAPTEGEIAAWRELPRDEQLRRLRVALTSPEATTPCGSTMAEIWDELAAEDDAASHG